MKTYTILHEDRYLARVEISDSKETKMAIKEMVEFWSMWKKDLADVKGDYVKCWLIKLSQYLLRNNRVPKNEEGWYDLDGSKGIKLLNFWEWEFDSEQTEIQLED